MYYRNDLERIQRELAEKKEDLLRELIDMPEGRFMCTEQDGYRRYLQRIPAKGNRKKEHRFGIKDREDVLNGLVRKEYLEGALKIIDQDIRALNLAVRRYKPVDENSIMEDFIKKYPELREAVYSSNIDIEEWKEAYERIEGYHPENLKHTAADGTRSRSKNEIYIASRLDHYGIIYRWDCPTGIPGLKRVPDYTILRVRDWKVLYWEHLGMMDVPEYRIENKKKIEEYEKVGIVPWDNLMLTYDTIGGGLRADLIEATIKGWLL